jgi:DNA/RNA-binding domain of Phe-tRNA-synthetase-like protein
MHECKIRWYRRDKMYFEVSKEVFDKLPDFVIGVVAVQGIDNSKEVPAIEDMLDRYAEECRQYFEASGNKAKDDPCVSLTARRSGP